MPKKLLVWLLEVTIIFGMAACTSRHTENHVRENPAAQNLAQSEGQERAVFGAQYAYSSVIVNFTEDNCLGIPAGSDVLVHDMAGRGEKVYVLLEVREWGEEPEDNTQKAEYTSYYQVFSCMADGSGKTVSEKICLPESGGYVSDLHVSEDGCVGALFHPDTEENVRLLFWDAFQNVHWEKQAAAGGYLFFRKDGFVLLVRKGEEREIFYYDSQGELTDRVQADGSIFDGTWNCYFTPDDRFLVIASDQEGIPYAEWYDPKTGGQERQTLPDIAARCQTFLGTTADVLLCDSAGVYQSEPDGDGFTELFSYVDVDLDIDGFQMVYQIDERRLAGIFSDGGVQKLGVFERSEVPEALQKQVVVLGFTGEMDPGLRRQILAFNRENSRYRITIKQYLSYNEELDAIARLNTDILSGNMPDILLVDEKMPLQSYSRKGLLADVGKLIEEDEELDGTQFMENVLDAFRVDGVLYYVIPAFCVDTLVAKQSKVEDRRGWNQDEFFSVLSKLPQGTEILSETSRYDYLRDYMRVCGREYVDMDQGKCSFRTEGFVSMLQFAGLLPETVEKRDFDHNSFDSRYLEDRALLQPVTIRTLLDPAVWIYGSMGEDIAYVGYPAESREGSCIRACEVSFVLSQKGGCLDGAWEFARSFLTEDFQRDRLYEILAEGGLPIRKGIFEERAQRAAVQEGYCFVNDAYIPVPPMTQEQIDRVVDFIGNLHNPAFEDEVIRNIIYEEAESFFQGQKTAEDVAGLIQNRVQLYLDERM